MFYLHCCILKWTHKHCNRFFESHYSFETFYAYSISQIIYYIFLLLHINLKKYNASGLLPGVNKVEENFHTKRVNQKFFVTVTTNIARTEQTKNHKNNYKRVKKKLMQENLHNVLYR